MSRNPRSIALQILQRPSSAYDFVNDDELPDKRDRALVKELVNGVWRWKRDVYKRQYVPSVVANYGFSEDMFDKIGEGFPLRDNVDSEIVSLLGRKKRVLISKELHLALADAFGAGKRALLFMNKRGTASSLVCADCGHVVLCPRC